VTITRPVPLRPLLLLFVLSGAASLIYEVVWARQLVLVFGNTSQAVSAILTGFFGGLAIGGVVGGWLADRSTRPLRLYAAMELLVAIVVVITPVTFRLIGELYRGVYPAMSESPAALALVRFVLSVLALGPATVLMGATLPTLTRFLTQGGRGLAGAFQRLYAANTIGAIVGTLLAGLVLIEILGLTGALLAGAACSLTAGLTALLLEHRASSAPVDDATESEATASGKPAAAPRGPASRADADRRRRLALSLAFVSGLTALGYQVVWNRMLSAGTGNFTYVFTIILALFLIGIATGALLLGTLRHRVTSMTGLIGVSQLLTAVFVVIGAAVLASPESPFNGTSFDRNIAVRTFVLDTAIVVLPATVAMGLTFPATAALLAERAGEEGSDTGALLAVNTTGSIVATFLVPFVLIPLVGSPGVLAGLAIVNVLVGGWLLLRDRTLAPSRRAMGAVAAAGIGVVTVFTATAGSAFRSPTIHRIEAGGGEIFAATEDEIASVEAGTLGGSKQLWVSGTSMTVLTADTMFMPLLPLMLRPEAKRGLVIAFGMGTAFRTSLEAGVRTDAVELVPSVPEMFHWFYPDAAQVLSNPQGHVIIADGRNHVELTGYTYDFVVVDPPPPIESSGVSVISTLEFYRAAKARLTEDGVMMQWVPNGQTRDEFLAHVRTFLAVFPNVRVIAGPGGNGYYLLGSEGSVEMDPALMRAALERPGVLQDVNSAPDSGDRSVDEWVSTLEALTWASGDALRGAVGDGPLITDDRPLPEYFLLGRLANRGAPQLTLDGLRELLK
jgi:spermidine synthase